MIRTADVDNLMLDWARGIWPTIPIGPTLSADAEAIAIYRMGGNPRNIVVDSPTIGVEVKARTLDRSMQLALDVYDSILDLAGRELGGLGVNRVDVYAGPANLPVEDAPNRTVFTVSLDIARIVS